MRHVRAHFCFIRRLTRLYRLFGPNHIPRLQIGPRNAVEVDAGCRIQLVSGLDQYKQTVGHGTWNAILQYADDLRSRKVKMAYFSATPQGGGVALMRHALLRFFRLLRLDVQW